MSLIQNYKEKNYLFCLDLINVLALITSKQSIKLAGWGKRLSREKDFTFIHLLNLDSSLCLTSSGNPKFRYVLCVRETKVSGDHKETCSTIKNSSVILIIN